MVREDRRSVEKDVVVVVAEGRMRRIVEAEVVGLTARWRSRRLLESKRRYYRGWGLVVGLRVSHKRMWRVLGDWNMCFAVDGRFGVVAWCTCWVVEKLFGEVLA